MNLHLVSNAVLRDSRVLRETGTLLGSGLFDSVEIAGVHRPGLPEREEIGGRRVWRVPLRSRPLPKDLASQSLKYLEWRHRVLAAYRGARLGAIHCHDLEPLAIAAALKKLTGAKLIYDAHELETERTHLGRFRKPFARAAERRGMRHVDALITVSPSIREWYAKRYPEVPVHLVRNVPERSARPAAEDLRTKLGVPDSSLLFIFQGGHGYGRSIEVLLDAFDDPTLRHHVVFMGEGALAEKVRRAAEVNPKIHWIPPVEPEHVLSMAAGADVGLSLIEDVSLSYRYCLPNKLFEYWLAGIPVVASDLPDQAALVRRYNAGWLVSTDRDAVVRRLRDLSRDSLESVRAGVEAAASELSWDDEARELLAVYERVLD